MRFDDYQGAYTGDGHELDATDQRMLDEQNVAAMDRDTLDRKGGKESKAMTVQGSYEWLMERLGHVTASRFADVMTQPKTKADKEAGVLSQTAQSYMVALIGEHLTQQPSDEVKTYAMEWGTRFEPVARERYEGTTKLDVQQVGFVKHTTERFIGCSPDSIVGDDGMLEIKCPLTAANHVRVLLSQAVPKEHFEQIQGGMWVCDRQWCDFVSYHDNFPNELKMAVIRVHRDKLFIDNLSTAVVAFRDELLNRIKIIHELWKAKVAA